MNNHKPLTVGGAYGVGMSCSPPRSNIFVEPALMADRVLRQARAAWGDVTPKPTERNRRKRNRRRVRG